MATPGFRALRAGFPDARITLHLRESQLPLVAGAPWFDAVLPVRSFGLRGLAPLREGLALRSRAPLRPRPLPTRLLLVRADAARGGARHRDRLRAQCAELAPRSRAAASEDAARRSAAGRWLPRELHVLGLVEAAGCAPRGTHLELFVTPEEEDEAERALAAAGVASGRAARDPRAGRELRQLEAVAGRALRAGRRRAGEAARASCSSGRPTSARSSRSVAARDARALRRPRREASASAR